MSFIIIFIIVLIALCFVVITSALLNFFSCVWTQSATFRVQSIASALRRALCVNEDPTSGKEEEEKNKRKKSTSFIESGFCLVSKTVTAGVGGRGVRRRVVGDPILHVSRRRKEIEYIAKLRMIDNLLLNPFRCRKPSAQTRPDNVRRFRKSITI